MRDPRTLAPPIVYDNKRYSDPTSSSRTNNNDSSFISSTREEIENQLTSAVKDNVISTAGTYVNSQGTIQTIKSQVGPAAGSFIQDTTTTIVGTALPIS